jgi:hypothetical protein
MWLQPAEYSDEQVSYLAALGRAMALAQHFEHNCRFVFGTWDMIRAYEDGEPRDVRRQLRKKLRARFLGAALKAQRQDDTLSAEQYAKLEAAVSARNYLAHEASIAGQFIPPHNGRPGGTKKLKALLDGTLSRAAIQRERQEMLELELAAAIGRLTQAVDTLAEADLMMAVWCHLIEERHEPVPRLVLTYVRNVRDWVLEPVQSGP